MNESDDDLDIVRTPDGFVVGRTGFSFATKLETSARIAVVAPREVRRKDRRVGINRYGFHGAQITARLKLLKHNMDSMANGCGVEALSR